VVQNSTYTAGATFRGQPATCSPFSSSGGSIPPTQVVWDPATAAGQYDLLALSVQSRDERGTQGTIVAGDDLGADPGLTVVRGVPSQRGMGPALAAVLLSLFALALLIRQKAENRSKSRSRKRRGLATSE
jgi:hypothetical protein